MSVSVGLPGTLTWPGGGSSSAAGRAGSGWRPRRGSWPRAAGSSSSTATRPASTPSARELPGLAGIVAADVADRPSVDAAFAEVDRLLGGVDVVIANAGISIRHRFLDITPEEWRQVMAVNLDGVFHVAQEGARRMAAGGRRRRSS